MKKILSLIFVCTVLIFTACSENSDTTAAESDIDETKLTEQSTTGEAEMSDDEYLINLAEQLEIGMEINEILDRIGEPDEHLGSGCLDLWLYRKGEYKLYVDVDTQDHKINEIYIYDRKNDKTILDITDEK